MMAWNCVEIAEASSKDLKVLSAVMLIFTVPACQTIQHTGRSQFIVVSESQESQLGNDAYREVLNKQKLSANREWQARLTRVGQRIAAAAEKPEYKWEFNVIEGKEINAFALPGGKVAFWEGIMPVAQDDTGVAVIMGMKLPMLSRRAQESEADQIGSHLLDDSHVEYFGLLAVAASDQQADRVFMKPIFDAIAGGFVRHALRQAFHESI